MPKIKPENQKQGRGISLSVKLWTRIHAVATAQEKSVSEVIDEVVSLHLPVLSEIAKIDSSSNKIDSGIPWKEIDDA